MIKNQHHLTQMNPIDQEDKEERFLAALLQESPAPTVPLGVDEARTLSRTEISKNSEESLHRRLIRLDMRIRNQFDLITSRTGWLLTSHAFLLTALAATLNAGNAANTTPAQAMMRMALLLILPIIGAISSYLVWQSVRGAYTIVGQAKIARTKLLKIMSIRFNYEITDGPPADVRAGDRPPKIFPWIMFSVWMVLFAFAINVVLT